MFIAAPFTRAKREKQSKYLLIDEWVNKMYTYNEKLFSLKKKGKPVTCYNMDEP